MTEEIAKNKIAEDEMVIIAPDKHDGKYLWHIAKETQVLDLNSSYSYNLIASHFSQTSALVYLSDKPAGFVSAYIIPDYPQELFVWQIGVLPQHHGKGLAFSMLKNIIQRKACQKVTFIKATIAPSNIPSNKLFQKVAKTLKAKLDVQPYYHPIDFPEPHEGEKLITIGPINSTKQTEGGFL